jgi:hypothetical protein
MSLGIITALFTMIFKFLPDIKFAWSDVWLGGFITAALFNIGKFLIGVYIGRSTISSVYGAMGSLVIVLVWVFIRHKSFSSARNSPASSPAGTERKQNRFAARGSFRRRSNIALKPGQSGNKFSIKMRHKDPLISIFWKNCGLQWEI